MRKVKREEFEKKIEELEAKLTQKVDELDLANKNFAEKEKQLNTEWETKTQTLKDEHNASLGEKDDEIEGLEKENTEKQKAVDRKEAKKLAQAYEEQELIYRESSKKWLGWLIKVAGLLVISTIVSIWLSTDKAWYDKFEYYLIDIIFISAVWFCGSQYADQIKLRDDYANRKTLAQSFHNILNNLPEDEAIKSKYIEKATDVLCAPNPVSNKEPVLSKKLVKDIAEIIGSMRS